MDHARINLCNARWRSPLLAIAVLVCVCALIGAASSSGATSNAAPAVLPAPAPAPGPEKWLPEDTLAFVSTRSLADARAMFQRSPEGQMWSDPALRGFREKLWEGWKRDVVEPLERELSLEFKTYLELLQGPATLALIRNEGEKPGETGSAWLLVADSGKKSADLEKALAELQKRWFAQGKGARSVTIQERSFVALSIETNSPVGKLRRFLPRVLEMQELGTRPPAARGPARELLIGRSGSLLMLSTSVKNLEKVLLRLGGGAAPVLADQAAYHDCHGKLFVASPVYGWLNAKPFLAEFAPPKVREGSAPPPPSPVDVLDKNKLVQASGLAALRAIAFSVNDSVEGLRTELFLSVPEAERQGFLRIFAGDAKPCDVPAFVPADVTEFQRWRIDGQRAWATIEKTMAEISPQWLGAINFIIDTANQAAQQHDPGFDVRKNLIGNLGDDIITYSRAPKPGSAPDAQKTSLLMIASPNPTQLAASLQRILIFMTSEAESPQQREFLGRTVYSIPLPPMPLPFGERGHRQDETLHYGATSSYVVLSTDVSLLEEHLRSATSQAPGLRDLPGLKSAAQTIVGQGTSLLAYKNQAHLERIELERLRTAGSNTNSIPGFGILSLVGVVAPEKGISEWMDYSLLPPFERIAKYFHLSVRAVAASSDGITVSWFNPTPPVLRREAAREP